MTVSTNILLLCLSIWLTTPECNGQLLHSHSSLRRRIAQSEQGGDEYLYSNNNQDGRRRRSRSRSRSDDRRIVLIAGPHKTGSTSIQNNMYRWMTGSGGLDDSGGDEGQVNDTIMPSWSWPGPNIIYDVCNEESIKEYMHGKIFYPFGEALHGCKFGRRKLAEYYTCGELLDLYKDEFKKKWDDGYNLAIGTEAFDLVGSFKYEIQVADIIQQMPTNNLDHFTVVLKYRSPRVTHLISWYHECCMKDMSFPAFLVKEMTSFTHRGSRIIDSLYLVQAFLDFGLNVTLIDLSGVHEEGYDLSNVIACDVMNAPCTDEKTIIGDNVLPEIKNVKKGGKFGSITDEHLGELEKIIRKRDCHFTHLRDHPKLNILYARNIFDIMDECEDDGISREEMSNEIRKVGEDVLSKADDH